MTSLWRSILELKDGSWRRIHGRIRDRDLDFPFVPSPWEAPWTHPGTSYFTGGRTDKFAPGWLFGDDDLPLRVGPREPIPLVSMLTSCVVVLSLKGMHGIAWTPQDGPWKESVRNQFWAYVWVAEGRSFLAPQGPPAWRA